MIVLKWTRITVIGWAQEGHDSRESLIEALTALEP
jgi:hypothetical protein